jgi:hypothetical protein
MSFAEGTSVSAERSKAEIETLLKKYGADQFVSGWGVQRAMIGFRASGRFVRFELRLPSPDDARFAPKRRPHTRSRFNPVTNTRETFRVGVGSTDAYDAEVRRLWRALALVVKAKLEAVQSGIATFESEFASHIVMPDGRTVYDIIAPEIEKAYSSGKVPLLLLGAGE